MTALELSKLQDWGDKHCFTVGWGRVLWEEAVFNRKINKVILRRTVNEGPGAKWQAAKKRYFKEGAISPQAIVFLVKKDEQAVAKEGCQICIRCKKEKPISAFKNKKVKRKKTGQIYKWRSTVCDDCFAIHKSATDKRYYKKNRKKLCKKAKDWREAQDPVELKKKKQAYDRSVSAESAKKNKIKRQTKEYKEYVRDYYAKNRTRIRQLSTVTSARHIKKKVETLSDTYIVEQLLLSSKNTFTRAELYKNKNLLDIKRSEILLTRLKKKVSEIKKQINQDEKNDK